MKTIILVAILMLVPVCVIQAQKNSAALIVYNAEIHTLDSVNNIVQAMAIVDGYILKMGNDTDVLKLKRKNTILIDAGGKVIVPGIFDSHLHIIRGGRFYNAELRWDGVRTLKRALQMLKEQAFRTPEGHWVRIVGGWNAWQFEEKRLPTLQEINDATGNVPAFILHLYGHAYINRAGLEALGIDSDTQNPNGGLIEKDIMGKPTGMLIAEPNAFILYSTLARLPELNEEEKTNSTRQFMWEMNRLGVTSVMDAGGGFQNYPDDYSSALLVLRYLIFRGRQATRTGPGSENGIAYFSRGISNFPINEGIILSTGNALLAKGPNYTDLSSGTNTWLGDQQLLDYIIETDIDPYLVNYWNATVVEFDFTPLTDHFSFPFVFASEEYGAYQCDFSDAFAFFLTNTETGETTNLALVPGTDTPISVVTIRDGSHFACDAANEEYFEKMNVMENQASAIDYNGQTVLLTAASDVTPNTVYHIKLVIADRNDGILDSVVFIGPFDIGGIDLGNDLLVDDLTALCEGDSYTIDSGLNPEIYEIKWFFNGEEIAGETNPEITINQAGEYTIEAYYIPSSCSTTQSLTVEYYMPVNEITDDPADLVHCDRNDLLFDFTENTNRVLEGLNPNIYVVSYHSSENDAVLNQAALENPHASRVMNRLFLSGLKTC